MKYRPEIDGLRALAVVPVILFHAEVGPFGGGYVGVDVFFVISGYLITSIILSDMEQDRFSLGKFYERRARRILPALFLVVLVCVPLAWVWLAPGEMAEFSGSVSAVATFTSNLFFWRHSGYFGGAAELKPLLHTWSLAVEEQYYIVFPIAMLIICRRARPRVAAILASFCILSLGLAQWAVSNTEGSTGFFLLPTRGWEILVGAVCAVYLLHREQDSATRLDESLGWLGLALIVVAISGFDSETPTPSLYTLLPVAGTALIILSARTGTRVRALIGSPPLVAVGLVSYSAYLWHQPMLAFARSLYLDAPPRGVMLLLAICSLVLAWFSWRFVEVPFRKQAVPTRIVVRIAVLGTLVFTTMGLAGFKMGERLDSGKFNPLNAPIQIAQYSRANRAMQDESWQTLRTRTRDPSYDVANNEVDNQLWFANGERRIKVLLVGNSHSKDLYNVLQNSRTATTGFDFARYGVQIRDLVSSHPVFSCPNYRAADMVVVETRFDSKGRDARRLESVVKHVLGDGKGIVLVKPALEFSMYRGGEWTLFDRIVYQEAGLGVSDPAEIATVSDRAYYNEYVSRRRSYEEDPAGIEIVRLKSTYPDIVVMDRMEYACDVSEERCYSSNSSLEKFYFDYGHNTLVGAEFFGGRVDEVGWLKPLEQELRR